MLVIQLLFSLQLGFKVADRCLIVGEQLLQHEAVLRSPVLQVGEVVVGVARDHLVPVAELVEVGTGCAASHLIQNANVQTSLFEHGQTLLID